MEINHEIWPEQSFNIMMSADLCMEKNHGIIGGVHVTNLINNHSGKSKYYYCLPFIDLIFNYFSRWVNVS